MEYFHRENIEVKDSFAEILQETWVTEKNWRKWCQGLPCCSFLVTRCSQDDQNACVTFSMPGRMNLIGRPAGLRCPSIQNAEVMWTQQHYSNLKIADVKDVNDFKEWKTVTPAGPREYRAEGSTWRLLSVSIWMINELPAGIKFKPDEDQVQTHQPQALTSVSSE